jgi:hypothetical protein
LTLKKQRKFQTENSPNEWIIRQYDAVRRIDQANDPVSVPGGGTDDEVPCGPESVQYRVVCSGSQIITAGTFASTTDATAGTGGSIGVNWPSTSAGQLALLYFYAEDDRIVNTPAGWTLIDRHYNATGDCTTALFATITDGTESGALTVNGSGWGLGQSKLGKIYIFNGVDISDIGTPSYVEGNGSGAISGPTLTGEGFLALAFTGMTASQAQDDYTGETGGDWAEVIDDQEVQSCVQLQSATITGTSISGGSKTPVADTQGYIVTGITLGGVTISEDENCDIIDAENNIVGTIDEDGVITAEELDLSCPVSLVITLDSEPYILPTEPLRVQDVWFDYLHATRGLHWDLEDQEIVVFSPISDETLVRVAFVVQQDEA